MKNKKMILWIALIIMVIIPVYAQQYNPESNFHIYWDKNVKDGIVITNYIGTKKEVRIPPSIQNKPVTGIGERAFSGCTGLTSVTIPNSVISIGRDAFIDCHALTSVIIPNSVTTIEGAFRYCTSLTSVSIPNSVTYLSGFNGCTSLASVTIPNSVTSIGYDAFSGCTSLTSINIPDSVTSIGEWAFSGCTSLTNVTIPNSVTIIETEVLAYYPEDGGCRLEKVGPFDDDLRKKYLAKDGGPGTYTRFANSEVWRKQ